MITIAVAGGTSPGLGRDIVTALLAHPTDFNPVILSRSSKRPTWLAALDVEIRTVDYTSQSSLVSALAGVHTVCGLPSLSHTPSPLTQNRSYPLSSPQMVPGHLPTSPSSPPPSPPALHASPPRNGAAASAPRRTWMCSRRSLRSAMPVAQLPSPMERD